jgi:hypothetical protein
VYVPTKYKLVPLSSAASTEDDVDWLWPGYMPLGSIGMLDGDPGLGKSMVTMDLASRMTKGLDWPDGAVNVHGKQNVLVFAAEDSDRTMQKRVKASGGDPKRVFQAPALPAGEEWRFPDHLSILEEIVTENKIGLVIIDPVMAFLSETAYRDQSVRKALTPLKKLCERTGCVVLFVRHLTKGGGRNAKHAGGGSMGLLGACRFGYMFTQHPEDPDKRCMAFTKMNLAAPPVSLGMHIESDPGPHAVWDGEVQWTADELMRLRPKSKDEASEREEAEAFLADYMKQNGGLDIAKAVLESGAWAGFSRDQIKRAKARVGVRSKKVGNQWYWVTDDYAQRRGNLSLVSAGSGTTAAQGGNP